MNFDRFCKEVHRVLEQERALQNQIDRGRELVSELCSHVDWFREYLRRMIVDPEFIRTQNPSIWPNEITLYRSPDGAFLVLAYLWEARLKDTIHDHGSWGIIGSLIHPLHEIKYDRHDEGREEGSAELRERSSRNIDPGETTYVLPLNNGIHRMENRTNSMAVTVNVYGRVVRKGYIQFFDLEQRTVTKVYPPKSLKQVLAIRALGDLDIPGNGEVLEEALRYPLPDYMKKECERSLSGHRSNPLAQSGAVTELSGG